MDVETLSVCTVQISDTQNPEISGLIHFRIQDKYKTKQQVKTKQRENKNGCTDHIRVKKIKA